MTTVTGTQAATQPFEVQPNADGSVSPYHVEDAAQRAALVTVLQALASHADVAAILVALGALTHVDSSGAQLVTVTNPSTGGASGSVTVTSSVLPTGAATAAGIQALITALGSPVQAGVTQAVSAAALPLPAGAATGALQQAIIAALGTPAQVGGKIDTVIASTSVNRGASFTSAAAVTIMPANTARRGLAIQNQGTSAIYMSTLATATADFNSLLIPAGGLYTTDAQHVGTGAVSVICPERHVERARGRLCSGVLTHAALFHERVLIRARRPPSSRRRISSPLPERRRSLPSDIGARETAWDVTMAANTTFTIDKTNMVVGSSLKLILRQDSTAGRPSQPAARGISERFGPNAERHLGQARRALL